MDEAKRFLRFIMPGALFGILTLFMLVLLLPTRTIRFVGDLGESSGVGIAIAGLVGSGALGYIFSAIHHQLVWSWPRWSRISHLSLARRLLAGNSPVVVADRLESDGSLAPLSSASLDGETAQSLCVSLWYGRLGQDPIKSGDSRVSALTDTAHSAGIATVAAVTGLVVAVSTAACVGQFSLEPLAVGRFIVALAVGLGTASLFASNYQRVGRIANMVIENVLIEAVKQPNGAALRITI